MEEVDEVMVLLDDVIAMVKVEELLFGMEFCEKRKIKSIAPRSSEGENNVSICIEKYFSDFDQLYDTLRTVPPCVFT